MKIGIFQPAMLVYQGVYFFFFFWGGRWVYVHHTYVARHEELQDVFIPERCKDIMNRYNIIPDPIAKVDGTTSNLKKLVGEKDTETKSAGALKQVRFSRCPIGWGVQRLQRRHWWE